MNDKAETITARRQFGVMHFFSGSGGGAIGFARAKRAFKGVEGCFITLGGIDSDPGCCKDFARLTGVPATCLDLFDRSMYNDFWGKEPPAEWREAIPADVLAASGGKHPDVIFLSPPCKGFSGLLPEKNAKLPKYQALNKLVIRSMQLAMDAYKDDLPAAILIENVPRITKRGADLLRMLKMLLGMYGYEFTEGTHDCGELGGLGQTRKRFLLIARNPKKLQSFIYEPPKLKLKSIGEVLKECPPPGDIEAAGPMHRLPNLQWRTWVRLALIPAGKDWRALNNSEFGNAYRIIPWDKASATVTGAVGVPQGALNVADPRCHFRSSNQMRIVSDGETSPTITGSRVGSGGVLIADSGTNAQLGYSPRSGAFRVVRWGETSPTITAATRPGGSNGISAIADPRLPDAKTRYAGKYKVEDWGRPARTVCCDTDIQTGALSVSDPRTLICKARDGAYGILDWDATSPTIPGNFSIDNRPASVADPRQQAPPQSGAEIPADDTRGVWMIISEDGTWHRPITTFEMAMLQSLPAHFPDGTPLVLAGSSEAKWREHIGNMVPPASAEAIAGAMLETMLPNMIFGEWHWNYEPDAQIWVRPATKRRITA